MDNPESLVNLSAKVPLPLPVLTVTVKLFEAPATLVINAPFNPFSISEKWLLFNPCNACAVFPVKITVGEFVFAFNMVFSNRMVVCVVNLAVSP